MIKKIILDTNFLAIPCQFRVDIFDEIRKTADFQYRICVLDKTIDELSHLAERKGKAASAAKIGLMLAKKKAITIIKTESEKGVDDILLEMADSSNIIATTDIALKKAIKEKGAKVMVLRQKSHISLF